MRYIKTDWYQWHDTHASLLVQVDWHQLLVPENWSVCMALYTHNHDWFKDVASSTVVHVTIILDNEIKYSAMVQWKTMCTYIQIISSLTWNTSAVSSSCIIKTHLNICISSIFSIALFACIWACITIAMVLYNAHILRLSGPIGHVAIHRSFEKITFCATTWLTEIWCKWCLHGKENAHKRWTYRGQIQFFSDLLDHPISGTNNSRQYTSSTSVSSSL